MVACEIFAKERPTLTTMQFNLDPRTLKYAFRTNFPERAVFRERMHSTFCCLKSNVVKGISRMRQYTPTLSENERIFLKIERALSKTNTRKRLLTMAETVKTLDYLFAHLIGHE